MKTEIEKREAVLKFAASCVGTKENPAGSNNVWFNTEFYGREVRDGDKKGAAYPWCGTSASMIFNKVGLPLGTIDYSKGFAGCPYALKCVTDESFIKKNPKKLWGKVVSFEEAQPGDLVFYDWDHNGQPNHVGILKSKNLQLKTFNAYEGNTSFGNDSNGGEFMDRARKHFAGVTFVRPNVYNS